MGVPPPTRLPTPWKARPLGCRSRMPGKSGRCFIALGGNLGDRLRSLSRALRRLAGLDGLRLRGTSSLYLTAAQYVTEQPPFLNAVAEFELSPARQGDLHGLLLDLKKIEAELGRRPGLHHGPRVVDLDIVAVGDAQLSVAWGEHPLEVPHALMHERDFVLLPLAELCPQWRHPGLLGMPTARELLRGIQGSTSPGAWPERVFPLAGGLHGRPEGALWRRSERTLLMGVVNATPDSFSDGGKHARAEDAVAAAQAMLEAGADILDVGGESTRPGATEVPVDEEIRRVAPVVRAIRERAPGATISVDTRKAAVARAAVAAGADWINDVSGGEFDPLMLATAAELMTPIVLMHMKGTPQTMNALASYASLIEEVGEQLIAQRSAAQAAGVPSWNVILDPGIGFAKTLEQNLLVLRRCGALVERLQPSPVLVGASRKRFLGTILSEPDATRRVFGNAAATAAAIAGGVDLVRAHEVREMAQTARVCDRIFREA